MVWENPFASCNNCFLSKYLCYFFAHGVIRHENVFSGPQKYMTQNRWLPEAAVPWFPPGLCR